MTNIMKVIFITNNFRNGNFKENILIKAITFQINLLKKKLILKK